MAHELPSCITKFAFISRGATGWVFKVDDNIALKYVRKDRLNEFKKETDACDLFERHGSSPYLIQSFLRLPGLNFLQFMSGGSLDQRIYNNQRRDYKHQKCLEVLRLEPVYKIEQWLMELSAAIAWLESLGLVHGDLRPANILLDDTDCLKLADFDCLVAIGSRNMGNAPPWARIQGAEAGPQRGTFGMYGATSEQFTFGSILYNLTRGFELYEDIEGNEAVSLLALMKFPDLSDAGLDRIIDRCWRGEYASLADLAGEMANLAGAAAILPATLPDEEHPAEMREKCHQVLEGKLAGIKFEALKEKLNAGTTGLVHELRGSALDATSL
ncbi:hypothetical protein AK830_g4279 [Neonectria ditissima]|uniref:EKC/KEOPS complex subunit BUD32 n=1 Tax=Neonectria ditissima TaxID=78410 RepID=A0A0P7B6W3_9HYPO|nr:hypothetical protein AK830_g4279 [Neonectria ditissima]